MIKLLQTIIWAVPGRQHSGMPIVARLRRFRWTVILTGLVFLKWGKEWRAAFTRVCENWIDPKAPRGVFVLCSGRVKLSTSSADGRTLILRMSESGEVLGLPTTVTGKPYELTDDVIEPTQANFVARDDFLRLARTRRGSAARGAAACETYHSAVAEVRTIGLSHSAGEKLARFLLELCADDDKAKGEISFTVTLTHEEIAQIIGASRETVTRLFSDFKKKQLLQVKGSTVVIKNKAALESSLMPN